MSSTIEYETVDRRSLTKFDKRVSGVIMHIVNNLHVKYRMPDSTHVLLYPPDSTDRPFKVSASRPAEASLRFITDFTNDYCGARQVEWEDAERRRRKTPPPPPARAPKPAPVTQPQTAVGAALAKAIEALPEQEKFTGKVEPEPEPSFSPETDDTLEWPDEKPEPERTKCRWCEYENENPRSVMNHENAGHKAELRKINGISRTQVRNALTMLAEATGVDISPDLTRAQKRVEDLEAQVAALTEERDSLQAKFDLAKEAFGL